jgi:hypothetical protein
MMSELELVGQFDEMNKVIEEMLKGSTPSQISKNMGLKLAEVNEHVKTWKTLISRGEFGIKERATEALSGADQHYNMIIKEAWDTVHQADAQEALNVKAQALKLIADVEQKRIDMLQKAGVLEKNDMADAILETERKQELLVGILRDVTSSCTVCKQEVARRLSQVTGKVETIIVEGE